MDKKKPEKTTADKSDFTLGAAVDTEKADNPQILGWARTGDKGEIPSKTRRGLLKGGIVAGVAGTAAIQGCGSGSDDSKTVFARQCISETPTGGAHSKDVTSLAYSPDGSRLASAGKDGLVKIWDAANGTLLRTYTEHTDTDYYYKGVNDLAYMPDGRRLVSAGDDGMVKIWDASTGQTELQYDQGRPVLALAISPDGSTIASTSTSYGLTGELPDSHLAIWDSSSGALIRKINIPWASQYVTERDVNFSADGILVADTVRAQGNSFVTTTIWRVSDGSFVIRKALEDPVNQFATSSFIPIAGDYTIITAYGSNIAIWDAQTGNDISTYTGHGETVMSVDFNQDGTLVVSGTKNAYSPGDPENVLYDSEVHIWDPQSVTMLQSYLPLNGSVSTAVFDPATAAIASGTRVHDWNLAPATIHIWDGATGNLLTRLQDNSVTFSSAVDCDDPDIVSIVCSCDSVCTCDSVTTCSCESDGHYWYPN